MDQTPIPSEPREPIETGVLPEEGYRLKPHFVVAIGMLLVFVLLVALVQAGALTIFAQS